MQPPRLSPGLTPMRLLLLGLTVLYIFWHISLSGAILTAADMETSRRLSSLARWTVGLGGCSGDHGAGQAPKSAAESSAPTPALKMEVEKPRFDPAMTAPEPPKAPRGSLDY